MKFELCAVSHWNLDKDHPYVVALEEAGFEISIEVHTYESGAETMNTFVELESLERLLGLMEVIREVRYKNWQCTEVVLQSPNDREREDWYTIEIYDDYRE